MTKTQTAELLALIAALDRRTIGRADVDAWHLIVGELDAVDCAEAVREHFTTSTAFLMPAHVYEAATVLARRRAGRQRLAELEAMRAAEEREPLALGPDDAPPLRRLPKIGRRIEPPDYADKVEMERRRAAALAVDLGPAPQPQEATSDVS